MSLLLSTDIEILEQLGKKFQVCRINRGFSQEQLAEHAGVSRTTITRLESGQNISIENFIGLLRSVGQLDMFETFISQNYLDPRIAFDREQAKSKRVRRK